MSTNNKPGKQDARDTKRWLRVGVLTLTVLGPTINTIIARLRERTTTLQQAVAEQRVEESPTLRAAANQGMASKPSLGESLLELKERPYAQDLLHRGEDLAEELRARSSHLSNTLVEHGGRVRNDFVDRSGEITRDLIGRGGMASQELVKQSEKALKQISRQREKAAKRINKRSTKAAKDLTRHGEKAARQLTRRSEKITQQLVRRSREITEATQELVERNGRALTIAGFGVGLISASVIAYLFIRRRMRHQEVEEGGEQHILLSHNGHRNQERVNPVVRPGIQSNTATSSPAPVTEENTPAIAVVERQQKSPTQQVAPADAILVGIVNTHYYYPVEMPLDDLEKLARTPEGQSDIIYFITEEEARSQGFSAGKQADR